MRHTYLYIAALSVALMTTGCEGEFDKDAALSVTAEQTDNVSTVGDTIVVKAGEPVNFLFSGDPDFITFYSGEAGSKYIYRDRTEVAAEDIASSTLSFKVWYQYGKMPDMTQSDATSLVSMFISNDFPGLAKNNFTADSALVDGYRWNALVADADMPQTIKGAEGKADAYTIDMKDYATTTFTLAIRYCSKSVAMKADGVSSVATQPKAYFSSMRIVNKMKDGTSTELYASDFGFTPVNMFCHLNLSDQKTMTTNREYGSVTNNTSGVWNMSGASTGSFFIHSSAAGTHYKYAWLVSNPIKMNLCSPDKGIAIKSTNNDLGNYSYTYATPGVYKATFVATNANYKNTSSVIKEVNVKVVK